ncbi:hypothetical protein DMUE_2886 [Dictyocoela muelleri]|nr:hypothetical protein DMUE_2886 [Dictyocoela muelleri]
MKYLVFFLILRVILTSLSASDLEIDNEYSETERHNSFVILSLKIEFDKILESFETAIYSSNKDDKSVQIFHKSMKNKTFEFNKDSNWQVKISNSSHEFYTKLIFYFNGETCTLNLDEEDALNFLTKDMFGDFVIPKDACLNLNHEDSDKIIIEYEIHPDYLFISKEKSGYRKNIIHIFCFMKGLFTISMIYDKDFLSGKIEHNFFKNSIEEKDLKKKQEMYKMRYPINASENKDYVLRADQQIAGEIYFHYFKDIVKNEKLILSRRLKEIFFVFDSSIEKMISKIIYSKFLFVDIPKDLADENIIIMKEIFDYLHKIRTKIQTHDIFGESVNLREELDNLRRLIDAKTLSPVLIQRALGYYNIEDYFFNLVYGDFYLAELLEDPEKIASEFIEKFNKKLWYKALYVIFNSGNSNDPNLPQKLKKNIKNTYNPFLNAEEYENLNGEDRFENLVLSRIYQDLEEILFFLEVNFNNPEKQIQIIKHISKTQRILTLSVYMSNKYRNSNFNHQKYLYEVLENERAIECYFLRKNEDYGINPSYYSREFLKGNKPYIFYSFTDKTYFFLMNSDLKDENFQLHYRLPKIIAKPFKINIENFKPENLLENRVIKEIRYILKGDDDSEEIVEKIKAKLKTHS